MALTDQIAWHVFAETRGPKFTTVAYLTGEPSNSTAHGLNKSIFLLFVEQLGVSSIAFDPCENKLYSANMDKNIYVVTLKTGEKKVLTKLSGNIPLGLAVDWTER